MAIQCPSLKTEGKALSPLRRGHRYRQASRALGPKCRPLGAISRHRETVSYDYFLPNKRLKALAAPPITSEKRQEKQARLWPAGACLLPRSVVSSSRKRENSGDDKGA